MLAMLATLAFSLNRSGVTRAGTESTYELGTLQLPEHPLDALLHRAGLLDHTLSPDDQAFFERMNERLPHYRAQFVAAEKATDIDWRLLAAIGYQESHWDPLATSPTGVRGLMMLTEETARRMNVSNRLDAGQSIAGGARYFALMHEMVPERVREPDRTRLALAAYNQGYGHLEDARVLAQRRAMNPDQWADVRRTLAMKTDPEIYPTTRLGFARGHEAVKFAERVWHYYGLLCRVEPPLTLTEAESTSRVS